MNGQIFSELGRQYIQELEQQAARSADRRDRRESRGCLDCRPSYDPISQPNAHAGDPSSMMILAAVAVWGRRAMQNPGCASCD